MFWQLSQYVTWIPCLVIFMTSFIWMQNSNWQLYLFLGTVLATSLLSSLKKQQFIKNNILCKESAKKTHYEKMHFSKRLDMGIIYLFLYRYTCSYTLSKLSFCFCMKWNSFFHQDMAQINSFGILLPTLGHNHWDVLNEV